MITQKQMDAAVNTAKGKIHNVVLQELIKESSKYAKYADLLLKEMNVGIKQNDILFQAGCVSGVLKKKFDYSFAFTKDTMYYFTNEGFRQLEKIRYDEFSGVGIEKGVVVTVTKKDGTDLRMLSAQAEFIVHLILGIFEQMNAIVTESEEKKKPSDGVSRPSSQIGEDKLSSIEKEIREKASENKVIALYNYTELTIGNDTLLRKTVIASNGQAKIYKRTEVIRALAHTSSDMLLDGFDDEPKGLMFFKSESDLIDVYNVLKSKDVDVIKAALLDGKLMSINEVIEKLFTNRVDYILSSMGIAEREEKYSVIVKRNLSAENKTSDDELSGFIVDPGSNKRTALCGTLPATVLENSDVLIAMDLAALFSEYGYETDVIDSNNVSIFDGKKVFSNISKLNDKDIQVISIGSPLTGSVNLKVELLSPGISKTETILLVKEHLKVDLKKAKDIVDYCPSTLEFGSLDKMQDFIKAAKDNKCELEYNDSNLDVLIYAPLFKTNYVDHGAFPGTESTLADVLLIDAGVCEKKINAIKIIREHLSLGLKEAKDLADNCPCYLAKDLYKEEAQSLADALREIGCTVELR